MTLRKTLNFDHLPDGIIPIQTNNYSGLPTTYYANTAGVANLSISTLDDSKWLGSTLSGGVYTSSDIRQLFVDNTKKSIIGFRSITNSLTNYRVGTLFNAPGGALLGAEVLASTVNTGTMGGPNIVVNVEHYIEIILDWVNYTQTIRVDGADKYQRTFTQAQMASILTTYFIVLIGTASATASTWWTKDWYFADAVGSEVLLPYGPCIVRAGKPTTAAAPKFLPSTGYNILASLNAKMVDVGLTAQWPNLQATDQASAYVAQSGFAVDYASAGMTIQGVELFATGRDFATGTARNLTGSATQGASTISGTAKAMSLPMQYGAFNYVMQTSPQASAWTPASLAASEFRHTVS